MESDKPKVVVLTYGFRTIVVTEDEAKEISNDPDYLHELVD